MSSITGTSSSSYHLNQSDLIHKYKAGIHPSLSPYFAQLDITSAEKLSSNEISFVIKVALMTIQNACVGALKETDRKRLYENLKYLDNLGITFIASGDAGACALPSLLR